MTSSLYLADAEWLNRFLQEVWLVIVLIQDLHQDPVVALKQVYAALLVPESEPHLSYLTSLTYLDDVIFITGELRYHNRALNLRMKHISLFYSRREFEGLFLASSIYIYIAKEIHNELRSLQEFVFCVSEFLTS